MYDNNEEHEKPFNDAIDHFQKVEGGPSAGMGGRLPLPIRIIGYCILAAIVLLVIGGVIGNF
ncbi:hypothetical protein ACFO3D_13795 [Virgibacillus kekensis]|uniref:Amino acid transporter n=1 Tax=Virgibacillus kekensis TaxID=202261 RepID=A0ABV9DKC6_9BACI